ncbi:MAG: 50S ribosomal protein L10 [Candidatus Rokubacteria bacterium]|nr:50S ribosomal protein L10 [Candidatus Rokubacteria bacterium]
MATQAKVESVEALRAKLAQVKTAILTEYRGLTVQQISDLRKQLRSASAEYRVVKNRLARLALQGSPLDCLGPHLKGPTGLVLGRQDPVALAKALAAFARNAPALGIKLGFVQGQLVQPGELRALADLPSRQVLQGQVVGGFQAPLASLVHSLEGILRALVSVLEQVGSQRETTAS